MKIDLAILELVNNLIFKHLREQGFSEIELSSDFYWNISSNELYDPYKQPLNLTIGQLSDNFEELISIAKGQKEVISYALVWLAAIYRAIGEKIVK